MTRPDTLARRLPFVMLPTLVLVAAACATSRGTSPSPAGFAWHAKLDRDHPLTGKIWDVAGSRFVDRRALVEGLADARFVLLGEKHDNPDHHALQAAIVRDLIAAGRQPSVAFEMLTMDQAAALDQYVAAHPRDASGLGHAVGWEKSGWPDWSIYEPIAQAALGAGLPIVAANLAGAMLDAMRHDGVAGLDPSFAARYRLDRPAAPEVEKAMAEEIRSAHCGHAPENILPSMILIQRARDAQMADRLVSGATADGAVLITGSGHARKDRGVPVDVLRASPTATVASLAFLEVEHDATTPEQYVREFRSDRIPFDYVWFTPRLDDEDPCEAFKKSLERMRPSK